VGSCLSATTRSQVVAFILTVMTCLLLLLAGFPLALDPLHGLLPQEAIDAVMGISFLTHFQAIMRGVLDLRDVSYFLLAIAAWLTASVLVINIRKAD
jgi:ABC-2 type transport system permease protein